MHENLYIIIFYNHNHKLGILVSNSLHAHNDLHVSINYKIDHYFQHPFGILNNKFSAPVFKFVDLLQ